MEGKYTIISSADIYKVKSNQPTISGYRDQFSDPKLPNITPDMILVRSV